jgi:prepilin-type N-terminal cleavage/methylation domain-containing protein
MSLSTLSWRRESGFGGGGRPAPPRRAAAAFTLIELLIVVAIIAILAAIAVPNFLEAQTRAKVSRVKNDLRVCATAIESYAVDDNSYPWDYYWTFGTEWDTWRQLTTPIAYLTTIYLDPFSGKTGPKAPFAYGLQKNRPSAPQRESYLAAGVQYLILSFGPDREETWDWSNFGEAGADLLRQMREILYDPTNGTLSRGDVIRTSRGQE